jgi:hypothetical protein
LKAKSVKDAVNLLVAADKTAYGITAGQITELDDAILNLEAALVLPRDKTVVRKAAWDKYRRFFYFFKIQKSMKIILVGNFVKLNGICNTQFFKNSLLKSCNSIGRYSHF